MGTVETAVAAYLWVGRCERAIRWTVERGSVDGLGPALWVVCVVERWTMA